MTLEEFKTSLETSGKRYIKCVKHNRTILFDLKHVPTELDTADESTGKITLTPDTCYECTDNVLNSGTCNMIES